MSIGERMRKARKARGLTQKQLAEKMRISYVNISQLERGERNPSVDTLARIAAALDVPMTDLIISEEPDREYEQIRDTLNDAGYDIEQAVSVDIFYITPMEDPDDPETRVEIEYDNLKDVIENILGAAERKKKEFIQKRIMTDIFGWTV